jgi:hypothetical protein
MIPTLKYLLSLALMRLGLKGMQWSEQLLRLGLSTSPKLPSPMTSSPQEPPVKSPDEPEISKALQLARNMVALCKEQPCHDSVVALMTAMVEIIINSVDSADEAQELIEQYAERAADVARHRYEMTFGEGTSRSVH